MTDDTDGIPWPYVVTCGKCGTKRALFYMREVNGDFRCKSREKCKWRRRIASQEAKRKEREEIRRERGGE